MTTLIESLPLLRAAQGVGFCEDWVFSIPFLDECGNALSLAGINFEAKIALTGKVIATSQGVVTGNIVTFTIYAADKSNWRTGNYRLEILASDGTFSKDLLTSSILTVGAAAPLSIFAISGGSMFAYAPVSAQVAALTAAVARLEAASASPVEISQSQPITAPGTYLVTEPGVTLSLASAATFSGDVFIVDWTGSTDPNITVTGAIGVGGSSATITSAGGMLWLRSYPAGPNFIVMSAAASGGGGGGGGATSGVHVGTDLNIGSTEL